MEGTTKRIYVDLTNDLIQGKELAKQPSNQPVSSSPSSQETDEFLIEKIILVYKKALTKLNFRPDVREIKTIKGNMMDSISHCSFTKKRVPLLNMMDP